MLEITKWDTLFENADTRKRQRLKFIYCPSGCDSNGYLELASLDGGMEAFGIFIAICQWSATQSKTLRGKLSRENGEALTIKDISTRIRVDACRVESACNLLKSKNIGWLIEVESKKSADSVPKKCGESASFVQGQGQGQGEGEGKGQVIIKSDDDDGMKPTDGDWAKEIYPTEIANRMIELQRRINSLHPSWTKRPHFSAKELHALHENAKAWLAVEADDWALLQAYMFAKVPDEWRKDQRDYFQPDNRLGLIGIGSSSILSVADKWAKTCKRHSVPTGIETAKAS